MAVAFFAAATVTIPIVAAASSIPSGMESDSSAYVAIAAPHLGEFPQPRSPLAPREVTGSSAGSGTITVTVRSAVCPPDVAGAVEPVSTATSPLGVGGTTSADLDQFARAYNAIRVANCLPPIALENFHFDACMQARLFWMAEDPSTDPTSAWGHVGSVRSDGVPSTGCDGNLAGGKSNTSAIVAQKWWDSLPHRATLYRPSDAIGGVCIYFAMTHGGVPNEDYDFVRAAARWDQC